MVESFDAGTERRHTATTSGDGLNLLSLVPPPKNGGLERPKLTPGVTTEIPIEGQSRAVGVRVPQNWDGKTNLPVLYYFNGMRPGGGREPESFTDLSQRADRMGFAIAYMRPSNDYTQTYHNGQRAFANSADENAYLNGAHNAIAGLIPIDAQHQGLAGFSQGASEAYDLAPRNPWVASVQGVEGYMTGSEPQLNHPVSEQNIHALRDPVVPHNGTDQVCSQAAREAQADMSSMGLGSEGGIDVMGMYHAAVCLVERDGNMIQPQRAIVGNYRQADGITSPEQVTNTPDMSVRTSRNDETGAEVRQVTLNRGTHGWAGSQDHSGDIPVIGQPNETFSASDAIAEFFLQHPLIQGR